ncbi:DUF6154 family protein [Tepidibacillus infernus]|uniref:Cytosolic protein n=1 Tax=Tepidibacillus decaturensis TaxID=1413211 RepID=A0A135L5C8_9BACI|nr:MULTISPECIES: DUF6154 family protein [Tepidibacillus]KXG44225.1 hypothetical protein U473_09585 [Tepidibacillus decaturensis]GBF10241.1 hypothetical protein HK1_00253 [Tepidibacillus sp. HK-1]
MKFVNEIYELYRNHLTGDEEDAVALVLNLLEDHKKNDILHVIQEMEEHEVYQMFAMYLIEMLKAKMAQESVGGSDFKTRMVNDSTLH